jgi:hypothetical protein
MSGRPIPFEINILGLTLGAETALLLENKENFEKCHSQILALGSTAKEEVNLYKILIDTSWPHVHQLQWPLQQREIRGTVLALNRSINVRRVRFPRWAGGASVILEKCPFGVKCLYSFTNTTQLLEVLKTVRSKQRGPLTGLKDYRVQKKPVFRCRVFNNNGRCE